MKKEELKDALQDLCRRLSALTRALDAIEDCRLDRMDVATVSFLLDGVCVTVSGKHGSYMLVVCAQGFNESMSDVSVSYMVGLMRKRVDAWYEGEYNALGDRARDEGVETDAVEAVQ